jgi:hypothetical protein
MDNLKKYLQQHLDDLDSDVPGDAVWQKIQETQAPVLPKRNVVKMVWRYAAAACVLVCIAAVFFVVNKEQVADDVATNPTTDSVKQTEGVAIQTPPLQPDTTNQTITPQIQIPTPTKKQAPANVYVKNERPKKIATVKNQHEIDPAQLIIKDVEKNYATLVNMQLERLRVTPVYAESPNYFSTFKQQLQQIEKDETTIKKDIRQHGLNDELLQQLININQQKLNVLKDLQAEISKLNNKVKQTENRADSSRSFYLNM